MINNNVSLWNVTANNRTCYFGDEPPNPTSSARLLISFPKNEIITSSVQLKYVVFKISNYLFCECSASLENSSKFVLISKDFLFSTDQLVSSLKKRGFAVHFGANHFASTEIKSSFNPFKLAPVISLRDILIEIEAHKEVCSESPSELIEYPSYKELPPSHFLSKHFAIDSKVDGLFFKIKTLQGQSVGYIYGSSHITLKSVVGINPLVAKSLDKSSAFGFESKAISDLWREKITCIQHSAKKYEDAEFLKDVKEVVLGFDVFLNHLIDPTSRVYTYGLESEDENDKMSYLMNLINTNYKDPVSEKKMNYKTMESLKRDADHFIKGEPLDIKDSSLCEEGWDFLVKVQHARHANMVNKINCLLKPVQKILLEKAKAETYQNPKPALYHFFTVGAAHLQDIEHKGNLYLGIPSYLKLLNWKVEQIKYSEISPRGKLTLTK